MSDPATDAEVAEITERLAKATPGPWECGGPTHNFYGSEGIFELGDVYVFPPTGHAGPVGIIAGVDNAALVTSAPTDIAALLARIAAQDAARVADGVRIAELEAKVFVPGQWRCPKCDFRLTQSNLYAASGTVGPRDDPGDKCPNCDGPLWRVSAMEDRNEAYRIANDMFDKNAALRADIEAIKREAADGMTSATGAWADAARERDTLRVDLAAAQAALRRVAIIERHRMTSGGGSVCYGMRCNACKTDSDDGCAVISHKPDCPLRAIAAKPDGGTNE